MRFGRHGFIQAGVHGNDTYVGNTLQVENLTVVNIGEIHVNFKDALVNNVLFALL